jgi:hypothetical protein
MRSDRQEQERYLDWATHTRLGRASSRFWTQWLRRGWWWKTYAVMMGAFLVIAGILAVTR